MRGIATGDICPGKCSEQGKGGGDEVVAQALAGLADVIHHRPGDDEQDEQSCQCGGDGGVSEELEDVLWGEHGVICSEG